MPAQARYIPAHRMAFWRATWAGALALLAIVGCQPNQQLTREEQPQPWLLQGNPAPAPASAPAPEPIAPLLAAEPSGPPVVIITTRFDIMQIRVPKGVFSDSGKIWNHIDEEVIPAATAALLQRNGLRVGLGQPDAWPPIHAMLEQEDKAETSTSSMALSSGLPLTIAVDQRTHDQTLFLYRADGTMAGVTCPASTNLIRLEYHISIDTPEAVEVEVMPEIRQQQAPGHLGLNALGQLDYPIREPSRILRELAFRMVVEPEQFVVIGPSPLAWPGNALAAGHLAGSLLLCETIEGRPYESMYFITPRQERSDRKAGR